MQSKVTANRNFNSTKAEINSSHADPLLDGMAPLKELRKTLVKLFDDAELNARTTSGPSRIDQLKIDIAEYLLSAMSESQRTSFLKEQGKEPDYTLREIKSLDASLEDTLSSLKEEVNGSQLHIQQNSKLHPK